MEFLFLLLSILSRATNIGHAYAESIQLPENPPDIVISGDAMLSRSVGAMTKKNGTSYITDGYNPFWEVGSGSFLIFNLESPFSKNDRDTHEPSFYFASNTKNIDVLSWLTKDKLAIISLANNHIYNAGFEGFQTTIDTLDHAGISHIGLSKNTRKPFVSLYRAGKLYCFGAYTYDGRSYSDKKTGNIWFVNSLDDAKNDIFAMNNEGCDEKIFSLHWGREYRVSPTESQKNLAHFLVDNGATLIAGNHSHILGTIEYYKNTPIFYSMGNLAFDQEWGRDGCEKNMDCIFDEKLAKQTVPTYIGTAAKLTFPYRDYALWQWNIKVGKLEKR